MNVLVTGGNGFVGSHLVDYLLIKDHNVIDFYILDISKTT
jgi:nucleoside-diphosphate-sugar epimerase